jgi:hypothetical protein
VAGVINNNPHSVWCPASLARDVAEVHRTQLSRHTIAEEIGESNDDATQSISGRDGAKNID